jgi:hypothetical protein
MNQYEYSPQARRACNAFFDALLELHRATRRREELGDPIKAQWDAAMNKVLAATQVALRAAGIDRTDDEAVAAYFMSQSVFRELRTGKTLQQEAVEILQSEMRR